MPITEPLNKTNKMRRLILFSMVCLMATATQAQNGTTAEKQDAQRNRRNGTPPHCQDEGQHAHCTGG